MNALLPECAQGFASDPDLTKNPHYWSSDAWLAYEAGAALFAHFVPTQTHMMLANEPANARKGRGYTVKIRTRGGVEFVFKASGRDLETRDLTREAC